MRDRPAWVGPVSLLRLQSPGDCCRKESPMATAKILVVDDEPSIVKLVRAYLA
jgi:hypothetical protein